MKKILFSLLSLILITGVTIAQDLPVDSKTQKITFTDVIEVEGLNAQAIFDKAIIWGANCGFQLKAKETGKKIQWDGSVKVKYPSVQRGGFEDGTVKFSVVVYCKDGRYKYTITNFTHTARHATCGNLESEKSECTRFQLVPSSWVKIKKDTKAKVEKYLKDMKTVIKKDQVIIEDTDDDW